MKHLILICLLSAGMAIAQTNNMRLNFGAGNVGVKTNSGYVSNPKPKTNEYGHLGNSESGMLTNFRGNINAMIMVNNNNVITCENFMRPQYITLGLAYDDLFKRTTYSVGYGQSTEFYLPFQMSPLKGYWSANLALMDQNEKFKKGLKMTYNGYSKKYGIEISSSYFGRFINTAIIHKKIVKNFMVMGGIEQNYPKAGLEYMIKFFRISIHTTKVNDKMFPGFTTTFNL